jgi:hypothetical protein
LRRRKTAGIIELRVWKRRKMEVNTRIVELRV